MEKATLRQDIVVQARAINALGINQGTFGNISGQPEVARHRHPCDLLRATLAILRREIPGVYYMITT